MAANEQAYLHLIECFEAENITLVSVSKLKPVSDIEQLYQLGQRHFGENYVQELVEKQPQLPNDVCWHFIGHLQTNKVKYIAPSVHLIHSVDSFNLLKEIDKQGVKNNRVIDCLLQVHIAQEETKYGLDDKELDEIINKAATLKNVQINGLMGMASFSNDEQLVRKEFKQLKTLYDKYDTNHILSMGMSSDYKIAIEEGSNMVRIGSLLW